MQFTPTTAFRQLLCKWNDSDSREYITNVPRNSQSLTQKWCSLIDRWLLNHIYTSSICTRFLQAAEKAAVRVQRTSWCCDFRRLWLPVSSYECHYRMYKTHCTQLLYSIDSTMTPECILLVHAQTCVTIGWTLPLHCPMIHQIHAGMVYYTVYVYMSTTLWDMLSSKVLSFRVRSFHTKLTTKPHWDNNDITGHLLLGCSSRYPWHYSTYKIPKQTPVGDLHESCNSWIKWTTTDRTKPGRILKVGGVATILTPQNSQRL